MINTRISMGCGDCDMLLSGSGTNVVIVSVLPRASVRAARALRHSKGERLSVPDIHRGIICGPC